MFLFRNIFLITEYCNSFLNIPKIISLKKVSNNHLQMFYHYIQIHNQFICVVGSIFKILLLLFILRSQKKRLDFSH